MTSPEEAPLVPRPAATVMLVREAPAGLKEIGRAHV